MIAFIFEKKDYGLLKLGEQDIPNVYPILKFPIRTDLNAVATVGSVPNVSTATMLEFQYCGKMPTGEPIYINI